MKPALLLVFLAACGDGFVSTCSTCGQSFTDEQCNELALANGCESGSSFEDLECNDEPTRGCEFLGRPTGASLDCDNDTDTPF